MITKLSVRNYRSIGERVELDLGRLTALVGPNGAGKSSLTDALRFIADALQMPLSSALAERGGIRSVAPRRPPVPRPSAPGTAPGIALSDVESEPRRGGGGPRRSCRRTVTVASASSARRAAWRPDGGRSPEASPGGDPAIAGDVSPGELEAHPGRARRRPVPLSPHAQGVGGTARICADGAVPPGPRASPLWRATGAPSPRRRAPEHGRLRDLPQYASRPSGSQPELSDVERRRELGFDARRPGPGGLGPRFP